MRLIFPTILIVMSVSIHCQLPIIAIPGLNDNCDNSVFPFLASSLKNPVHCFDPDPDSKSIFTSLKTQITNICKYLDSNADKLNLLKGFYFFGVSQGGLLARASLETCATGAYAKKLITLGAPHMGVIKVPHSSGSIFSKVENFLTDEVVYSDLVQDIIGPAGYYHSLAKESEYLKSKALLADLNNERGNPASEIFKSRITSLEEFVMVLFTQDTMIIPKETAHFGFYKDKSEGDLLNYQQLSEYKNLGLDELEAKKALFFYEFEGEHVHMTHENLEKFIFPHCDPLDKFLSKNK